MEDTEIKAMLTRHGLDFRQHGINAVAVCPKCGGGKDREKCWSINLESSKFICNRANNCGWTGNLRELQKFYGEQPVGAPAPFHPIARVHHFTKPKPDAIKGTSGDHYAWFDKRHIGKATVDAFGITAKDGEILFPVYDPAGDLVNVKYRKLAEKKFRNEKGTLRLPFGLQLVPADADSLVIVEGEIDALTAYQYGIKRVISLPNGAQDQDWIEHLWPWLERFTKIWISTDMDEAGRKANAVLVERLGQWRCRAVDLPHPHKDLNECLMAGVPVEEVKACLDTAQEYRPEKLRNAADFTADVIAAFENNAALYGVSTGFAGLNTLLKGWRGGELTVWTGQNGSGKSTIIGQAALNLIVQRERVCVASLELDAKRYLRWLVCQQAETATPNHGQITQAMNEIAAGLWLIDHVGSMKLTPLLDTFEYAARRYGVRHFVVDSLVKLGLREEDYSGQVEAVSALSDFADRFDCHVHLVAHPRKGASDGDEPGKCDVKGSGGITDLADNVIALFRNPEPTPGQASTIMTLKKNREHGVMGKVPLAVDPDSKRVTGWEVRKW